MTDHARDIGVIQALLERLEGMTLPRALDILAKVDGGGQLDELDTRFLDDAMQGAAGKRPLRRGSSGLGAALLAHDRSLPSDHHQGPRQCPRRLRCALR